jgi:aryl-alcohol dehydrogenase-like predicted oxidoreductase
LEFFMQMRPLGTSGIPVSLICLGTMTYGQQNTESEGHEQMDYAVSRGVNFFDTAELYAIPPKPETQGSTERIIGSWFKARGNRDKIILATKVIGRSMMTYFRDDKSPGRLIRSQMTEALEKSLKRLNTDYIDLYQIHWPERAVPWGSNPSRFDERAYAIAADEASIESQLRVFEDFVKAGKVRHIGLSNESAWGVMSFLHEARRHGLPVVQSVQNSYNFLNRTYETALAEVTLREHVGLLAYSPLAQGYLSGKYLDGARPPGARTTLFNRGQRYETPGAEAAIRAYVNIARDAGLDPALMANAFVNSRTFLTANIIGATTMAQLKVAIDSADTVLSADVLNAIDETHQRFGNTSP